jgi:hypothetical protein
MGTRDLPLAASELIDTSRLRNSNASSALDFRVRTIISGGFFLMPMPRFVLIGDDSRFARLRLLSGRQLGGFVRLVMGPEGFRECLIDFVRPTAIVSNDFISNFAHTNSRYVDRAERYYISNMMSRHKAPSRIGLVELISATPYCPSRRCG